ncbi:MAG: DUF4382 domain-containing protein [Kangiellaceae bacterium]|nr:DUF4382 domain-containing protein [Kangiellaceae bacterium]
MKMKTNWLILLFISISILGLSGCGGSSEPDPLVTEQSSQCETGDDDSNDDNCGSLLLGLTDADGDFLTYNVQVTGIELIRNDGTAVSVMPSAQSIDFVDYVEMSELVTAATVPAGIYTQGTIQISYQDADIQVEKDGAAVAASMVDADSNPLNSVSLTLQLDEDNRLVIHRNRPALIELDFNLAASHTVNLETDPVTITTEPFIIAEVDPVMNKEFRIRGPLIRVNEDESSFRIAVRPFHRRDGRFGGVNVQVDENTNFEIDGEAFVGAEGVTQMAGLSEGTPTVTLGLFERDRNSFTGITVLAGSSVPGSDSDAVKGVIVARDENQLTVRGASIIRDTGDVSFREEVTVLIGEETRVSMPRRIDQAVTIADLSVGQAITVAGDATITDEATTIDATQGAVKMRLTFASGHATAVNDIQLNMELQALQARSPEVYDFSGTGIDPSFDADPLDYEVSVENLMIGNLAADAPVRVSGFITPFGAAPADFDAYNLINYAESRSQLYVDWPDASEEASINDLTSEGFSINIINNGEEGIYKLLQGGIRTELTSFDTLVSVSPKAERGIYTLRLSDSVMAFSDFADFAAELQQKLDEGMSIDKLHAIGGFSTSEVSFSALKIAVKLDE